MDYTFSWSWFVAGIAIMVAAVLFIRFHQWIADNFGAGVGDYERYKLYGLIAAGVGLGSMVNLIPIVLTMLVNALFK